jgi:hypothetical protein
MSIASPPKLPSERSFGFTFGTALAVLGLYGIIRHRSGAVYGACLVSGILFAVAAGVIPRILGPLNKAWFYLGLALGKVMNPIVLGIIFFGILTPVSILLRLFGRDALQLKRRPSTSYWMDRTSAGFADHFKNQF